MVFLLLVSVLFADPLPSFNWWAVSVGGEELKWHQLAHHQLMSQQGPHFIPQVKIKPFIKAQISGKLVTNGISDVAIASVHSEKTRLKMIMIITSVKKIARNDGYWRVPEIDFCYETEARKVMVDFKFDALYRCNPGLGGMEKITGHLSLYGN